jgi:hypothetical protein
LCELIPEEWSSEGVDEKIIGQNFLGETVLGPSVG